jgi:hypothetical protein
MLAGGNQSRTIHALDLQITGIGGLATVDTPLSLPLQWIDWVHFLRPETDVPVLNRRLGSDQSKPYSSAGIEEQRLVWHDAPMHPQQSWEACHL